MSEGHQSFNGIHPEVYAKWMAYEGRSWYVKPEASGQNPEQHVLNNPVPTGQPLVPTWSSEQIMRIIQANTRINPDGVKAVRVDPTPVEYHGPQPTNPAILEREAAYNARKWYPEAYYPYKGWPNREIQSGIHV